MRFISVGFACNNACAFCAQGELRNTAPRASDVALDVIAGEEVAFVGGEPTLAEDLPAWIAECDRRGASRIVVQTNGRRLAYRAWAERLAAASKRLELEVSLHGSTAAMHDYHTQVPGSFGQTLRGLGVARALGVPRSIVTVVTRSNFRHLTDVVRIAHSFGASALLLSSAEPLGHAARARDRIVPAPEMVEPHLRAAKSEGARVGLRVASTPEAFVGLGETEPVAAPQHPQQQPPRVRLAVLGRPQPALQEARSHDRRSGESLREILPALFDAKQEGG